MKILILGGYGVFGGRLAELLSDIDGLNLIICGRGLPSAQAFCSAYKGLARVHPAKVDRQHITEALRIHKPDLVVDASGPFQEYGGDGYRVIKACIAACIDYLDFADAADFVFGVTQFDSAAYEAGVFVLSGVSSFPVLTAAVLRDMANTMDIVTVEGGIAPSPYAGIGQNVMRAVVGYAGAPVMLRRHGQPASGIGLAESMRFTVAVPGRMPLRNIHFSLVDVPDLQVIPPEHPTMTDIWMGAGPVPEILHRVLNLLAQTRARFGLPAFTPFSGLFYTVLNLMRFGEHRGGMFIRARGRVDGKDTEQSWHMLAEGNDGPYIPSMAIEAVVRKLLSGSRLPAGARSGARALDLKDYEMLFRGRQIYTGFRGAETGLPIYQHILGSAFGALPQSVQDLHGGMGVRGWSGHASVQRGPSIIAKVICAVISFPEPAARIPVSVTFAPEGRGERWTRDFGGKVFTSLQFAGTGRNTHLLVERFGIASVALALVVDGDRLRFVTRSWSILGFPMPTALLPSGQTFEREEDGQFCFDIEITMPLVGLIVAYRGKMAPDNVPR